MSELIFTTETIHTVDFFKLSEFVAKVYGLDTFEILETPNDSSHRFTAKKGENDNEWDQKDLAKAQKDGDIEIYFLGIILNDLADRDLIPEGDWLVEVCW